MFIHLYDIRMRITHVFLPKSLGNFRRNLKDFWPSSTRIRVPETPLDRLSGLRQDHDYIDQFEAFQDRPNDRRQRSTLIYAEAPRG
jgi:hypothetical protein